MPTPDQLETSSLHKPSTLEVSYDKMSAILGGMTREQRLDAIQRLILNWPYRAPGEISPRRSMQIVEIIQQVRQEPV